MIKKRIITQIKRYVLRQYSTATKTVVIPDKNIIEDIDNNVYKPRNHPGILKPKAVSLPTTLIKAIETVTADHPVKALIADSVALNNHLKGKHEPIEKNDLRKTVQTIQERVIYKFRNFKVENEQDEIRYKQAVQNKMDITLSKQVYNWKPVNYNAYNSLVYLFGRIAPEYAVLHRIFSEIHSRDSEFQPRSLFDFGSGVGSATWAAKEFWKNSLFEYFNVDSSAEMNELAQLLLQDGRSNKTMSLKGVFYRQFLPAANISYDLVVSAYTLLELPSRQSRLETIINLWNKCQQYLVIVEQGTNAGFRIINEVRDFILQYNQDNITCHVFSPCPNDSVCPRYIADDNTPCNFEINYFSLPIGAISERKHETFCYIILKRGGRSTSDPQWPRVVRPTLVRSKHSICRMCTKNGELKEVIFTASKHGKTLYYCARSTKWGDLLPITLEESETK